MYPPLSKFVLLNVPVARGYRLPPCRIHATIEGVEWLMYNRTAAYDDILAQMDLQSKECLSRKPGPNESTPLESVADDSE